MAEKSGVKHITVSQLLKIDEEQDFSMGLEVLAGVEKLGKKIVSEETNRPGLPLAGFFDCFANQRIQIFGRGEIAYVEKLVAAGDLKNIEKFFSYDIPVCIVTHNLKVPKQVIDLSNRNGVPFLRTKLTSKRFFALISTILAEWFAPFLTVHGNFVSIYNIGVLITGKSGIGKSESILGLVERGHKFISDDMVKIKKIRTSSGFELIGEPYLNYGPFLEIRGIGIINVSQYYGEGRILKSEKLELIIDLHEWDSAYNYDRLGMDEKYEKILEMDVPKKEIPVRPGRNIPLLIEVAAYREIIRKLGYNSAEELNRKVMSFMKKEKEVV
jgi:HPr kinase/phosphorylase